MVFRVSGQIDLNAAQAQAELAETRKSVDQLKGATTSLGTGARAGAQGVRTLEQAAAATTQDVIQLGAAQRQAANDAVGLGRSSSAAAGSMGNLVAQFNDIGVMMAAGQNPLQLAIQQGTQITQVIGPMGAAGAAKALGAAFMSMLSPINFITIASIAAAAALSNWLMSGRQETVTFEEAMTGLSEAVERYSAAIDAASVDTDELRAKFGVASEEARALLVSMAEAERREVQLRLQAVIETRFDEPATGGHDLRAERGDLAEFFGFGGLRDITLEQRQQIDEVIEGYRQMSAAADGSVDEQIAALESLIPAFKAAAEAQNSQGISKVTADENARLLEMERLLLGLYQTRAEGNREELINAERLKALGGEILDSVTAYTQARLEATQAAYSILDVYQQEAQLQALIAQYGEESSQVADFRAAAERAVLEEQLRSLDVADSLKAEILAAYDAAQDLAATNIAAGIGSGADEAARLAQNLGISYNTARMLAALGPQGATGVQGGRGGDPRQEGGSFLDWQTRDATAFLENWKPERAARVGRGGGGGRAQSIDRERQAVERLLERQQQQLDVLRETDPVQQELIRYRETMRSATDAERAALGSLIQERIREKQAIEEAEAAASFSRETLYDMFEGAALRGESLADVIRNSVIPALLRASLLGEGPLAGLFGGKGLIGMVFPALAKADGGYISGPGDGRSDDIPMWGSSGEFMINARATRRHRHLLEHINAGGDVRGFADGGMVGSSTNVSGAGVAVGGGHSVVQIALADGLIGNILRQAGAQSVEIVEFSNQRLPSRINTYNSDPRRRD